MTKFEIGDRVKCIADVHHYPRKGGVYTVTDAGPHVLRLEGVMDLCSPDIFELYAKAGEFVAGDWVVAKDGDKVLELNLLEPGKAYKVEKAYRLGDCLYVDFDGSNNSHFQSRFRLATPEEIAADMGDTSPTGSNTFSANCAPIKPRPKILWVGDQFSVNCPPETNEIPAAEFDFSTIKAGDEVTIKVTVTSVASDFCFWGEYETPDDGPLPIWLASPCVHSVIPAPKPKTLRERITEAVEKGVTLEGIVDAVLAEVEKG